MITINEKSFIEPIFKNNVVPICFSANNSYIPQTAVMIESIVENSSKNYNYDIIILSTDIDKTNENNVILLAKNYKNISIRIFDISALIDNVKFYTDSVYTPTTYSKEAYFRLFIPFVMPNYDKVIYFDGDMVAISDVSPLINIDMTNYMAAATRDFCGIAACYDDGSDRKSYRYEIGIKDIDSYFISSMVVLNMKMFNEKYPLEYVKNLISSRNWRQHDQDILNVLCQDNLLIVDAMWSYFEEFDYSLLYLPDYLVEELLNAQKNARVVHYAGQNKAWVDEKSLLTKHFWDYASRTPYFDLFYNKINHKNVSQKYHVFKNNSKNKIGYYYKHDDIVLTSTPHLIGSLSDLKVCIEFLTIKDGFINISGFFETIDFLGTLKLNLKINGSVVPTINSDNYRLYGNNSNVRKLKNFSALIELDCSKYENIVDFSLTYDDEHFVTPKYVSVEQFAPINEHHFSFYSSNDWILTKRSGNRLHFEKHRRKTILKYNSELCNYLLKKKNLYFTKMARVRKLYYYTKSLFRNKNIWLISDTLENIDNECIEFFKFLKTQKDIQPYFVVDKNYKNINELKKIGKVVFVKSKLHKFLFLHSKVVMSSTYDLKFFLPVYDRANEIRDMIANKKFIYWHKNNEDLSYNIKTWYNVSTFILNDKKVYNMMLKSENGYDKSNLFLIKNKNDYQNIFNEIIKE